MTLVFAALSLGFLGSPHCITMCGGFLYQISTRTIDHLYYQLGRLFSYLLLGILSSFIGNSIFSLSYGLFFNVVLTVIAYLWIIWSSYQMYKGKPLHHFAFSKHLYSKTPPLPFTLGLASALLPCHWLHSFSLTLLTSPSVSQGALLMFAFWLGSLLPLSLSVITFKKLSSRFLIHSNQLAAVIYFIFGIFSLTWRIEHLNHTPSNSQKMICSPLLSESVGTEEAR